MNNPNLAERYQILHKIGSGGGGEVYSVFDQSLQKNLALKIFTPDESAAVDDQSFFEEYLLVLRLSSAGTVRVYDFGYTGNNFPFYTMELLPEESITGQIKNLDPRDAMEVCRKIAGAISFLHFFKLIHNDLKPENVKLAKDNGFTDIRLLDLGLTVDFDPESKRNRLSGTVEYMAPELFESVSPGYKSDLYSLGVIFYKFASGHDLFSGDDPLHIISAKMEKPVPTLDRGGSVFPDNFCELTEKLLARNPDDRPDSAFEVARQIGEICDSGPILHDFYDLLNSFLGIKIARMFEKKDYLKNPPVNYLFHDKSILRAFMSRLKASLQNQYYNVECSGEKEASVPEMKVSPKAEKKAKINLIRLKPGEVFTDRGEESDCLSFNLILAPVFGNYRMEGEVQEITPDLLDGIAEWFNSEQFNHEAVAKLEQLLTGGISALADILNRMQAENIISFDGRKWQCSTAGFVAFPTPDSWQNKVLENISHLSRDQLEMIRKLSVMRTPFDRHFARRYLDNLPDGPEQALNCLEKERILVSKDGYYTFRNPYLRVGLVKSIDHAVQRKQHLKAAGIIEDIGGVPTDFRLESLAQHYTLAEQLEDSVKWTLAAVKTLIAQEKYRITLKLVDDSLDLAEKAIASGDTADHKASLLTAKGDIENRLGLGRQSLRTFVQIIRERKKITGKNIIAGAYKHIGDLYKAACDFRRGLNALNKAREIYILSNNKIELSHTYNNIGNIYWVGSKIDKALESYALALEIQEDLNLLKEQASTLNNMGSCYIFKNQFNKTIEFYQRSIEIKKQINDRPELARTYNNLGAVYHELGNINEALLYLYQALKINREIDSKREILLNLDNIARCEITLGHYQKAESYVNEGLQMSLELDSQPLVAVFLMHKGTICWQTGLFAQADESLGKARELSDKINDDLLRFTIFINLARMYLELNTSSLFKHALKEAEDCALRLDDKKLLLTIQILKSTGLILFDRNYDEAAAIIKSGCITARELDADILLFGFKIVEFWLALEGDSGIKPDHETINKLLALPANQVFKADYLYLLARDKINRNMLDQAATCLREAANLAEMLGHSNMLWKIKYIQGTMERNALNYEAAYVAFKKAVTILKTLAKTIKNQDFLQNFLQHPQAVLLKQGIMELAGRMGRK